MEACARIRGLGAWLLFLTAMPAARADLIINEILASNTAYEIQPGDTPDLVEIYNTGPDDVTLGGAGVGNRMYLTDDPYGDYRRWWKFPLVTVLKAGEYLTVACDISGRSGPFANFQLDASAGVVALMDTDSRGRGIIDLVEYHIQYPNVSYARFENGDGTHVWRYTSRPTFSFKARAVCADPIALQASPVYCGSPPDLCPSSPENILDETFIPDIDGLDYGPALVKAADEVKVLARVGPSEDRVSVDLHYVLVAPVGAIGPEVVIPMHDDGQGSDAVFDRQGNNVGENDTWWVAQIPPQPPGTTVRFWAESYWKGSRPDPDPCKDREPGTDFSLYAVENTDSRRVHVNEVVAVNVSGIRDFRGDYDDWIEIHNASDQEVDVAGLYLTANPRNPTQWAFPLNRPDLTRIPPRGFIIVWCDGEPMPLGLWELHATLTLDGTSDRAYLANAKGVFDGIDWSQDPRRPGPCDLALDPQDADIALGRVPDGSDVIARILVPTPGVPNPPGPAPVIGSLKAGPDDPSCEILCGSPSFVVGGENLANPSRVLVDDGSGTIGAVKDVTASTQTLPDGSLLVADDRCGVGGRKAVWVYQGPPDALVAAKARFRCVPQITGMTPAAPQGNENVTLDLCGFDVLQSVLVGGVPVPFTPDPRPGAAPKTVTFFLPACPEKGIEIEVIDTDTYSQKICVCGTCGGGVRFVRGDADGDGQFAIGDAIVILTHMFSSGPIGCAKTADLDDNGTLALNDPIYLLSYMFVSGPAPLPPFPACGEDPTPDPIDCADYDC